jgi:hypothetical protein
MVAGYKEFVFCGQRGELFEKVRKLLPAPFIASISGKDGNICMRGRRYPAMRPVRVGESEQFLLQRRG